MDTDTHLPASDAYLEFRDGDYKMRKLSIEQLNTKARRHLKTKNLTALYTDSEIEEIKGSKPDPSDKWLGQLLLLKASAKKRGVNQYRRWSYEEDKFLKDTYMFLSDLDIALALNIPAYEVKRHRNSLHLQRSHSIDSFYLVWCNRENFDEDMKKYQLTKVRGDGTHPLLEEALATAEKETLRGDK